MSPAALGEARLLEVVDGAAGSPAALLVGIAVAVGVGALHALGPGHGKTVTAAWVAGSPTRRRDVAALAVAVALMHTLSSLVIGVLLFAVASSTGWLEVVGDWLRVASGALVLGVGVWLLRRRLAGPPTGHPGHAHAHHAHDPPHAHDHGDGHDHLGAAAAAGVAPTSARGLLLIAASGGLLPSPSALLVLTTGLFTGRALLAVVLVGAFGAGLAATLALVGLAAQEVRDRAVRSQRTATSRVARALPLLGPLALVGVGVALVAAAVAGLADLA